MATNGMLGFAIVFCFLALLLVCLGFATDSWVDVAVDRANVKILLGAQANQNPNAFTRHRGIFKVCYEGSETFFLDNNTDVVSGNCLWIKGMLMDSDAGAINYEDEYDMRNHLIRAHMASTTIGMVALLAGVILASIGCWDLSPRGFRMGGLIIFIGAFFVACGMGCFHGYDYLEREKINQAQQGVFPFYWKSQSELSSYSKMNYGWSYIVSWVGTGLAAIAAILLLCTAYNVQWDEDYTKYSEKKLKKKVRKQKLANESKQGPLPQMYGPPPYTSPAPSAMGMPAPPIYGMLPQGPAPVIEVPVEVPVPVAVEPPQVIPVMDNDAGYGYPDGYSAYGGQAYGGQAYGGGYGNSYY